MFKKFININQDYSLNFDFNKANFRRYYKNTLKELNQKIIDDIKLCFNQENNEIFLLIKFLIWESLKNSYDSCLDKQINQGKNNYFVCTQWQYLNGQFKLRIIDNGFGLKAVDSHKKIDNQHLYLGGRGKGIHIFHHKIDAYKKKYGSIYKLEYIFCPFGSGAIVDLEINIPLGKDLHNRKYTN